jgi:hypothetical protein
MSAALPLWSKFLQFPSLLLSVLVVKFVVKILFLPAEEDVEPQRQQSAEGRNEEVAQALESR